MLLLGLAILAGCVIQPPTQVNDVVASVAIGQEAHAGISDVFFTNEAIIGNGNEYGYVGGSASKIELTIAGATNEKLILNYAEYTKRTNEYGTFLRTDPWLIKSGFNTQFQYDLTTSKVVKFKEYEFEILGVDNNTVIYRRTK